MRAVFCVLATLAAIVTPSAAQAQLCTLLTTSIASATATLPTYSPIQSPIAFTLGVQITNNLPVLPCTLALTFNGPFSPAIMTSGSSQLKYTIRDTSDSATLLYVGASPGTNYISVTANPGTTTQNVHVVAIAGQFSAAAGSYSDNAVSMQVYTLIGNILGPMVTSATLTVNATVTKICTIGGSTTPSSDNATIPIDAAGNVNTTPILKTYANVDCNTPTSIGLSSANWGVMAGTSAPAAFSNVINYAASATFGGATASINTAARTTTPGTISTAGGTIGSMFLTITPITPANPLVQGAYSDVLSIALTPQ
jgi:hypothetical protein